MVSRKLKPVQEQEFDPVAFRKEYAARNGYRKLDYSEPSKFELSHQLTYADDIHGTTFEILENPNTGERMLAFEVSAFRNSHLWAGEKAFEPVEFTLQLVAK